MGDPSTVQGVTTSGPFSSCGKISGINTTGFDSVDVNLHFVMRQNIQEHTINS
jgi:hypothetical protein